MGEGGFKLCKRLPLIGSELHDVSAVGFTQGLTAVVTAASVASGPSFRDMECIFELTSICLFSSAAIIRGHSIHSGILCRHHFLIGHLRLTSVAGSVIVWSGSLVIQAKTGIQVFQYCLDLGVRRHDNCSTFYRIVFCKCNFDTFCRTHLLKFYTKPQFT